MYSVSYDLEHMCLAIICYAHCDWYYGLHNSHNFVKEADEIIVCSISVVTSVYYLEVKINSNMLYILVICITH